MYKPMFPFMVITELSRFNTTSLEPPVSPAVNAFKVIVFPELLKLPDRTFKLMAVRFSVSTKGLVWSMVLMVIAGTLMAEPGVAEEICPPIWDVS